MSNRSSTLPGLADTRDNGPEARKVRGRGRRRALYVSYLGGCMEGRPGLVVDEWEWVLPIVGWVVVARGVREVVWGGASPEGWAFIGVGILPLMVAVPAPDAASASGPNPMLVDLPRNRMLVLFSLPTLSPVRRCSSRQR